MAVEISRRERKKELTRQSLLNAAIDLFTGKGYDQTTIDDIVDRADVAKVTFYYYFKSKEELVLAIRAEITEQAVASAQALLSTSASAEAIVRALTREIAEGVENHRPLYQVFFQQRFSLLMAGNQHEQSEQSERPEREPVCTTSDMSPASTARAKNGGSTSSSTSVVLSARPSGNNKKGASPARAEAEPAAGALPGLNNLVQNIVLKGQESGEFRSDFSVYELSHYIVTNLIFEQFMWISGDGEKDLVSRMDRRIDLIMGGLSRQAKC